MKPATAARKLGVYLDATPDEFRAGVVSRDELDALQADPPEWLRELRRNGPHPRQVVADRLGVSISGLARAEIVEPLTTAQIVALAVARPRPLEVPVIRMVLVMDSTVGRSGGRRTGNARHPAIRSRHTRALEVG